MHAGHSGNKYVALSEKYLEKIRIMLKRYNINFSERHNENHDIDFSYMCKSKHFIPSNSGFSTLVKKVIKHRGNQIYNL
jgi:hypothetical protein